jgi:hypothetical protein
LPDRSVFIAFRVCPENCWLLDFEKQFKRRDSEGEERDLERSVSMRKAVRISRHHDRRVDDRVTADGVQQVRHQR